MATRKKLQIDNTDVLVQSAIEDGSGNNIENTYLKKDGYSADAGVGYADRAKQIEPVSDESGTTQETSFISQCTATANNTSLVDTSPIAYFREKQGNTIDYNQLVQNGNFNDTSNWVVEPVGAQQGSFTVSNNQATVTETVSGNHFRQLITTIAGHKYLCSATVTIPQNVNFNIESSRGWVRVTKSVTANIKTQVIGILDLTDTTDNNRYFDLFVSGTVTYPITFTVENVYCSDLTKWFNGDIPSDLMSYPEHFSWQYNGDYSYNVGQIRDCAGRYLECGQGRNIYNPQETYNRVIPNIEYYYFNSSATATTITYYDNAQNVIFTESVSSGNIFTTPSNCWYINSSVTSNITISEYYSTGDGYNEYYPYIPPLLYDTGTMSKPYSIGNLRNIQLPSGLETDYIDRVDLSTLTFTYDSSYDRWISNETLPNCKLPSANNVAINGLCAKWTVTTNDHTTDTDKTIAVNVGGTVRIKDSSITQASDIIGMLYYELATLTTEQGTAFSENIQINDYSYMSWKDTDGNLVGIPQGCKVFYPDDYVLYTDSLVKVTNGDVNNILTKLMTQSDFDSVMNGKGYYKQEDLSSGITDVADLTYFLKKACKIGNLVTITIQAKNETGSDISADATLFTVSSALQPSQNIIGFARIPGANTIIEIGSSGINGACSMGSSLANSATLRFTISYVLGS